MQQLQNQKLTLKQKWYSSTFITLEICKIAKNRELAFLPSVDYEKIKVRHINSSFIDILKKNFEAFHFWDRNLNLYYSLAHIDKMPMFSFDPKARQEQQEVFNKYFHNHFVGYDFGMDFDGNKDFGRDLIIHKNKIVKIKKRHWGESGITSYDLLIDDNTINVPPHEIREIAIERQLARAKKDCFFIKKEFDSYGVQYSPKFSGSKGFHINVPNEVLPDVSPQRKVQICDKLTQELLSINNLPTIDPNLCDERRIWKMDYSFVNGYIALPLDEYQFNNFELNEMYIVNVLHKVRIKNRGLLMRNSHYPLEIKKRNFAKLLKDYEVEY